MKKHAFTLAEVLLTLAIIGVVAALTIPAVITKVTQDQYVVGLKKAYNTLKSVEREAVQENGPIENWTWTNSLADFDKYFKPHFDILKDCGINEGCLGKGLYKRIGGTDWYDFNNAPEYTKFIASDGISYFYTNTMEDMRRGYFRIDVNGPKGPNQTGRDMFLFDIYIPQGIKPNGALNTDGTVVTSQALNEYCDTSSNNNGSQCTAKVLAEGAMNY